MWLYITLIIFLSLLLVGGGWIDFRYLRHLVSWEHYKDSELSPFIACPAVSVVVMCENEGEQMEDNLPKLLDQLGIDVEVIVVNVASVDTTSDALKRLKLLYPQMRQTYVPASNSNLNTDSFGRMLGARAARYDWVLFVRPSFAPSSAVWLLDLLRYAESETMAVVDYGHVSDDAHRSESRLQWTRRYMKMARSVLNGRAITTAGGSLLVRKEWLLSRSAGDEVGECVYLCRRFNPFRRVILRAQSRRPDASIPW